LGREGNKIKGADGPLIAPSIDCGAAPAPGRVSLGAVIGGVSSFFIGSTYFTSEWWVGSTQEPAVPVVQELLARAAYAAVAASK
jgi:hypothetical protein